MCVCKKKQSKKRYIVSSHLEKKRLYIIFASLYFKKTVHKKKHLKKKVAYSRLRSEEHGAVGQWQDCILFYIALE